MTNSKNSKTTAPLAHRIPAEVSPVITAYAEWLTEQTGYKVDPMSVYIGSQLRSTFQKTPANQARLAQAAKDRAAQDAAKAKARAEREAAAVAKAKAQEAADKVAPVKVSRKAQDKINNVMPKPAAKAPARRRTVKAAPVTNDHRGGVRVSIPDYWDMYDRTLGRIREEKPSTFTALKAILDQFEPPSSGDAFFPGGADDDLADALHDAGWTLRFTEGVYVYVATHPATGARLQHVEGDIYDQSPNRPAMTAPGARISLVSHVDPHSRLIPGVTGTVEAVDDAGTVHVLWDDGSRLGLIAGLDRWAPLHPRWDSTPMVQTNPNPTPDASASATDTTEEY